MAKGKNTRYADTHEDILLNSRGIRSVKNGAGGVFNTRGSISKKKKK